MAVNFNQDSVFNLKPISNDEVRGEVDGLFRHRDLWNCFLIQNYS